MTTLYYQLVSNLLMEWRFIALEKARFSDVAKKAKVMAGGDRCVLVTLPL